MSISLAELKEKNITDLAKIAKDLAIPGAERHAQAGVDLPDPPRPDGKERPDLLGRRPGMPARRLRLPARAGIQLSSRPGRHLRLAVANPEIRSAHRRHRLRAGPPAQGRRALFRADQGRSGQFRRPRSRAQQNFLRQPDAALSPGPPENGNDPRKSDRPRAGPALPGRQRPART